MEHITRKTVSAEIVRLVPDEGYRLVDLKNHREYSEAYVRANGVKLFRSVLIRGEDDENYTVFG